VRLVENGALLMKRKSTVKKIAVGGSRE